MKACIITDPRDGGIQYLDGVLKFSGTGEKVGKIDGSGPEVGLSLKRFSIKRFRSIQISCGVFQLCKIDESLSSVGVNLLTAAVFLQSLVEAGWLGRLRTLGPLKNDLCKILGSGQPDRTIRVLKELKDPRPELIGWVRLQPEQGTATNQGL